ncbi:MAG: hypothetical protein KJN89_02265 [Gammaproteobacteria bacterium]|nr:hypothetical protein [Gammaproteobacteria bacterium]NNJ49172.1 hypothetical protein [Gammaproteobacteria bacterium]
MNSNRYKSLRYVLIILLMFAPIRSAMAMQQPHCDMDEMDMAETSMSMQEHAMHDMSSNADFTDPMSNEHAGVSVQCCCCDSDCVSNCGIGVPVSLIIQVSDYSPVFVSTSRIQGYISPLLLRTLSPPSRPPATIS